LSFYRLIYRSTRSWFPIVFWFLFTVSCGAEANFTNMRSSSKSGDSKPNKALDGETIRITIGWRDSIRSQDFGLSSNPNVDDKSLFDIVSNNTFGRDDGQKCSTCHNSSMALGGYATDGDVDAAVNIEPDDKLSGKPWAGSQGWAQRFAKNKNKPDNLKMFFQSWIDSGYKDTDQD